MPIPERNRYYDNNYNVSSKLETAILDKYKEVKLIPFEKGSGKDTAAEQA